MEQIRPSADLRNHYNEIAKTCKENREAVVITKNGREDTVIMGSADYRMMKAEIELLGLLAEAEEMERRGETSPLANSLEKVHKMLADWKADQ